MKYLLLASALFAGCGDNPTSPTPPVDDRPALVRLNVPSGPVHAEALIEVDIIEAAVLDEGGGIRGWQAFVHHANEALWDVPAWDDSRQMAVAEGQGWARFSWTPGDYWCGRVRVAITLTRKSGVSQGVLLRDVQYGRDCE